MMKVRTWMVFYLLVAIISVGVVYWLDYERFARGLMFFFFVCSLIIACISNSEEKEYPQEKEYEEEDGEYNNVPRKVRKWPIAIVLVLGIAMIAINIMLPSIITVLISVVIIVIIARVVKNKRPQEKKDFIPQKRLVDTWKNRD